MKTSDFFYDLPEELIAQTPLEKRDNSRLLVLGKQSGEVEHKHFYDILSYIKKGDCLFLPAGYGGTEVCGRIGLLKIRN